MEAAGIEAVSISTLPEKDLGKSTIQSAAKSAAFPALSNNDADLAALLEAWPTLSADDRRAIMAIVEAARGQR